MSLTYLKRQWIEWKIRSLQKAKEESLVRKPRTVGPIEKDVGQLMGVGLSKDATNNKEWTTMAMLEKVTGVDFDGDGIVGARDKVTSTSTSRVIVAYLHEESPFKKLLRMDDEILEINGEKVSNPRDASQAMVDAGPTLTLLVNRLIVKRTAKTKWSASLTAA